MSLVWLLCGAGRRVGKTTLALKLCEVLPGSVYAKCGHGSVKADKPGNFFSRPAELESFIEASKDSRKHIVVESNTLAGSGRGDIVIFIDGIVGETNFRKDAEQLRAKADVKICSDATPADWKEVLVAKIGSKTLCEAVCDCLAAQQRYLFGSGQAVCSVEVTRIGSDAVAEKVTDNVVVEQAVTIMVDKVGSFTIMCTPSDVEALAVGFIYSEGMIDSVDDVVALSMKEELANVVGIQVAEPSRIAVRRNLIIASSCGMCGTRNIEKMLSDMPLCGRSLEISSGMLIEVTERLRSMQQMFKATGGSHAAGVFTSSGEIISFAEDLGRHTALDKAIGKCLLNKQSTKGCGVVLSGRVSLEMVTKAARAGIELIVAVSASSSFAVEAAERWNITLCGFVRPGKANIYTHPERIHNLNTGV